MSGHNKWSSIKHKKGAADAKRGKIFSRLAKEIAVAVRDGGKDPDMNPRLRAAINVAKNENMPNDNIDRAIKKGAGELGAGQMDEISYEGYAPGGVAILVDCLTDNRNRTAAEVRNIFTRNNGSLSGTGAVAWMFHRKARFLVVGAHADEEELMEVCLGADCDVEAINVEDGAAEIIAAADAFADVLNALEGADIEPKESGLIRIPENDVAVTEIGVARQVARMLDALEDEDDVQAVYDNADIADDILEQLEEE